MQLLIDMAAKLVSKNNDTKFFTFLKQTFFIKGFSFET